jgi:hypothetical protein
MITVWGQRGEGFSTTLAFQNDATCLFTIFCRLFSQHQTAPTAFHHQTFSFTFEPAFGVSSRSHPLNYRFAPLPKAPLAVCARTRACTLRQRCSARVVTGRKNLELEKALRTRMYLRDYFLCTNSFRPHLINSNNVSLQQDRCYPWRQQPNLLRRHGRRSDFCPLFQHLGPQ